MFRSLRLIDAFEHLATPEEWHWFGPMVRRGVLHFGVDGWPTFPADQLRAYPILWEKLADQALEKLRAGEWMAEGISAALGPRLVPIDTSLWDYMYLVDRAEEAKGAGFHFIALTISDTRPPKAVAVSQASQAHLRTQLTQWIKSQIDPSRPPPLRAEQLAAARTAFAGCVITDNMYRECRRAASLPDAAVQRGRPKAKASG
jgi:hypothetical protein